MRGIYLDEESALEQKTQLRRLLKPFMVPRKEYKLKAEGLDKFWCQIQCKESDDTSNKLYSKVRIQLRCGCESQHIQCYLTSINLTKSMCIKQGSENCKSYKKLYFYNLDDHIKSIKAAFKDQQLRPIFFKKLHEVKLNERDDHSHI